MHPLETPNTNHRFGAPPGREAQIGTLPCQIVQAEDGTRTIYSVWALSAADREAIANGLNLQLGVGWVGAMPPVSLGVTHEGMIDAALDRAEKRPAWKRWLGL